MKLVKSLLLGSAAGIAATAGAQAADLPYRKAAPVEYVRICDWTGAGYFYIPGTDTCLKVGGFVRVEYAFINQKNSFFPTATWGFSPNVTNGLKVPGKLQDASGFDARGRIDLDARTQTAYGTLRTYVRFDMFRNGGNFAGGPGSVTSFANQENGAFGGLDKGFIQFAGFTAGRVQSFFDFYADNYNFEGIANSDQSTQAFAYTATFGGGFSATLSIEDRNIRTDGIGAVPSSALNAAGFGPVALGSFVYAGQTIPDIVGVLRVDQAWGAAQLSAAFHDVNTSSTVPTGLAANFSSKNETGFAVQGGIQLKLPMLAPGDDFWLQGAYQQGAVLYQDSAGSFNGGFWSRAVGGFQRRDVDAYAILLNPATGQYNLQLTRGYSVAGAFHHYFTPTFHDVLFGSYEHISYGAGARLTDWTLGGLGNANEYRIGNQFIWTPVQHLDIGLELIYAHISQQLGHQPGLLPTALPVGIAKNPSAFEARLRMERDF